MTKVVRLCAVGLLTSGLGGCELFQSLFGDSAPTLLYTDKTKLGYVVEQKVSSWAQGCLSGEYSSGITSDLLHNLQTDGTLDAAYTAFNNANSSNVARFAFSSNDASSWTDANRSDPTLFIGSPTDTEDDVVIQSGQTEQDVVADCAAAAKLAANGSASGSIGMANIKAALDAEYDSSKNEHLVLTYATYNTSMYRGFSGDPNYVAGVNWDLWKFYKKQSNTSAKFYYMTGFTGWTITSASGIARKIQFSQSASVGGSTLVAQLQTSESLNDQTSITASVKSYDVVASTAHWADLPAFNTISVPATVAQYIRAASEKPVSDSPTPRTIYVPGLPANACVDAENWQADPASGYDADWTFGDVTVSPHAGGGCDFTVQVSVSQRAAGQYETGGNIATKLILEDEGSPITVSGQAKYFTIPASMKLPATIQPILEPQYDTIQTVSIDTNHLVAFDVVTNVVNRLVAVDWANLPTVASQNIQQISISCGGTSYDGRSSVAISPASNNQLVVHVEFTTTSKPTSGRCTTAIGMQLPIVGKPSVTRTLPYTFEIDSNLLAKAYP
jgi:hypothetical protein